ncbi:sugar-binding domain-containing protein [Actinoplanes sp. NPDC026619]|uniref:sugar-binding domain-containing protein n=1 Tax=Actinoplanes sp. NPDC026619 TaxID=3155798 RepID=UPI0034099748
MIIDLAGTWECSTGDGPWAPIELPCSWWLAGLDPIGPVEFRRPIRIPDDWAGHGVRLEFDGVDYAAAVHLDGEPIGAHIGGFAPFTVDVPAGSGEHELTVVVTVPRDEYGTAFPHTKHALRGVFGHHDARPGGWGPRGQERSSGGVWGGVRLRRLDAYTISGLGFSCSLTGADARVVATPAVELRGDRPKWATVGLTLTDPCDGSVRDLFTETWLEPGVNHLEISGIVAQPHLWWTWDHGEPHRYDLTVWIDDGAGRTELDRRPVGLREIRRDSGWVWRLNGRPVFLRGSNYIGSQWLSELTTERVDGDVALAVAANLNMLRVHAHVTVPGAATTHVLATDARRVLQAGPMRLPEGTYRIEAVLAGPDGATLSTNFFRFEVTP